MAGGKSDGGAGGMAGGKSGGVAGGKSGDGAGGVAGGKSGGKAGGGSQDRENPAQDSTTHMSTSACGQCGDPSPCLSSGVLRLRESVSWPWRSRGRQRLLMSR